MRTILIHNGVEYEAVCDPEATMDLARESLLSRVTSQSAAWGGELTTGETLLLGSEANT